MKKPGAGRAEGMKVLLLGNSGVGKTSIIERFVFNKFKEANPSTLGMMFLAKPISVPTSTKPIELHIWDTAGQEKYRGITSSYYKEAAAILIVYDVTQPMTFEGAKEWLRDVRETAAESTIAVLVGNKADLVDREEARLEVAPEFAKENGIKHMLISAKQGVEIADLFRKVAEDVMKGMVKKRYDMQTADRRSNGSAVSLIKKEGEGKHLLLIDLQYVISTK
eukprot:TRINITY_DN2227_c0_g1_i1.p1 TRINITY_DN2227_c0_g1~~TRINITY_DN2227_c0_g1_i1.p1  ORF type:complete len:222 (+),score=47.96 TRINITY_DN2227_c0_g1_i1:101-766(+)